MTVLAAIPNPFDARGWARDTFDEIMEHFARQIAEAAADAYGWLVTAATTVTTPDFSAGWFLEVFSRAWGLAILTSGAVMAVAVLEAVIRQQGTPSVLAPVVKLVVVALAVPLSMLLLPLLVAVVDAASAWVLGDSASNVGAVVAELFKELVGPGTDIGVVWAMFLAGLNAFLAFLAFLMLVFRRALIELLAIFGVILYVLWVWPRTASIPGRLVRWTLGAVVAKLPIAIVFAMTVGALEAAVGGTNGSAGTVEALIVAGGLTLLMVVAPVGTIALFDVVGAHVVGGPAQGLVARGRRLTGQAGRLGPESGSAHDRQVASRMASPPPIPRAAAAAASTRAVKAAMASAQPDEGAPSGEGPADRLDPAATSAGVAAAVGGGGNGHGNGRRSPARPSVNLAPWLDVSPDAQTVRHHPDAQHPEHAGHSGAASDRPTPDTPDGAGTVAERQVAARAASTPPTRPERHADQQVWTAEHPPPRHGPTASDDGRPHD